MNYNFDEKYDELLEKNKDDLDKVQIKTKIPLPVIIIGVILCLPILFLLGPIGVILIIVLLFSIIKKGSKYSNLFKERVTIPLLKEISFVEEVDSTKGIDSQIYKMADFRDSDFDKYISGEYIGGKIGNTKIELAGVKTSKIHVYYDENDRRRVRENVTFGGLVIVVTMQKSLVNGYVHIFSDKDDKAIIKFRENEEKVHMDSIEFEKEFDVYASNPIEALEILTSDSMQRLIDEKHNLQDTYEMSITQNRIILRIYNKKSLFNIRTTKTDLNERAIEQKKDLLDDLNYLVQLEQFIIDITNDINNKM